MADMSSTIVAKSDQLNAGDLLAGPVALKVTAVDVKGGDQPVSIHTESNLQPYKPCLSMRRVLAKLWGGETDNWLGKSFVLYNDPSVIWAGKPEGGIRISHMEGLAKNEKVTVRASKRAVTTYEVEPYKPMRLEQKQSSTQKPGLTGLTIDGIKSLMNDCQLEEDLMLIGAGIAELSNISLEETADLKAHFSKKRAMIKGGA